MSAGRAMLIVGAGEAGTAAALTLRQKGWEGPVILAGDEPLFPYERPPLSKSALTEAEDFVPRPIVTAERLAEAEVAFLAGRAVSAIDRSAHSVILSNGEAISYERLLLATGASPRMLAVPTSPRIKTLRTHADAMDIRGAIRAGGSVIVIGGGFIGLEVAASAAAMGVRVTVIEAGPRLLMRAVPETMAAAIHAEHEAAGVFVETSVTALKIEVDDRGVQIALVDGRVLDGDLVVIGIGAIPNIALAEEAGLAIDNGIATAATLATSDPDIFAAGDCCSFPHALYDGRRIRLEAWRNAQRQGACAAANMLGAGEIYSDVPWFWSDQYGKTLQIAGICAPDDQVVELDLGGEAIASVHLDDEGRLRAACAFGNLSTVAREIRFAEKAIARRAVIDVNSLIRPGFSFKSLREQDRQ